MNILPFTQNDLFFVIDIEGNNCQVCVKLAFQISLQIKAWQK